jgi:hypothetical protein
LINLDKNPSLKPYKYPLKNQKRWREKKQRKKRQENLDKKTKCKGARA